ncbi:ATP-dependent zinc metalloprotease FtsH [Clostridiales bacterium BX7]|uniref:ATP-dependent zinc metalloprotease FtsH n=2 Tax=Feifania hominis TaxID=2763660 RepID=A0A926HVH2_9FIRM|nr:ATP-dependent zinc metalloprotease FtsH [Feifania hominis]
MGEKINEQRRSGILTTYNYEPPYVAPWWMSLLPYLGLIVVMVLLWLFLANQSGAGGGGKMASFGKAKAKMATENQKKVTFADVAGADEEKEELKEVVDFLKDPRKYVALGARIPRGILLVGPPGTGKTLLAKSVAGEAGVPFFSISGSDFVEMFVGVGASRVRDLFEQAKKNAPAIIFIDEIDAVGRHRGAGLGGGHDEREQTLNQLLVEMDGFGVNEGVIIIAATNRPDILDPALLRPGRFDRQVTVNVPDIKGREDILRVHARGKPLDAGVNLSTIAKSTPGFTGADLANLLNEAALLAARKNARQITMVDIEEATIKVIAGPEKKSRVISEKERKLTAYHEGGHAIVTRFLPTQNPVHQISIIPRGRMGGYTMSLPKEDKYYSSRDEMMDEIVSLLGGRAAERLALTDISTGASNDIERATAIARKMVTKYGMSDKLGPMVFGNDNEEVFLGRDFATSRNFSEGVAEQIDDEIMGIIDACYKKAIDILTEHMDKLHEVARILYLNEKMDGDEFEALFAKEPVPIESADIVADKQAETRADEEIKRDDIDVPPPRDGQE